ncbi:hypothetical protein [Enterobacter kobei]|uniref:hypothetical protein n=1 Tax=Enterobacter kobei TaxID=208224 RepID=UPI0023603451|nr:hypothetical protein [Enterobacter kobei]
MSELINNVLDAMESLGRETSSVIGQHLNISNKEAIKLLLLLENYGLVTQLNGFWSVLPGHAELRYGPFTVNANKNRRSLMIT